MTNETMKILLMILIIAGIQATIHIPKIWVSQQWALLVSAVADVWSATRVTDQALQLAFIKRKSRNHQILR